MTYPEATQYLESFINYEEIPNWPYKKSLKLERIKNFLSIIGNPQNNLRCIHIAGTKGKGSTCVFITYILRQSGYKVGLYTSPHLSDFRERIRILSPQSIFRLAYARSGQAVHSPQTEGFEGVVSKNELVELIERLKPAIEKYNKKSNYGPLSFFEVYTSLAFVYFKEKKVDFVVLETGLGGRMDATNVVNPLVCAITPISYEHTQKLGNTLREIAAEKAGIIKSHQVTTFRHKDWRIRQFLWRAPLHQPIVVSAPQEKEALEVIRNKCKEMNAKLYEVGKDIKYKKTKSGFSIQGIFGKYMGLKIKLLGEHQLINATVATAAVEALQFYNITVDKAYIRNGLYNTLWPGRCEVISRDPLVVLDGAQNIASSRALKEAVKEKFSSGGGSAFGGKYKKLILVLGISNDKDTKGICNELYDLADEIVLTRANSPRATKPEILAKYFVGKITHITNNTREAKAVAYHIAQKEDLILVTGSLFVVGEFRDGKI